MFDLKQSGGSDYHGKAKPGIDLGVGRGNLFVSYKFYEGWLIRKDEISDINGIYGIAVYSIDDRYETIDEFNEDYWDGDITNETFTLEYSI